MSRRIAFSVLLTGTIAAGLLVPFATISSAFADFPQPSLTPVSWQLKFQHHGLERIFVTIDGKEQPFWFMRYTVINKSGQDILFTPSFELVSDTGQVSQGYKDEHNIVFEKIKKLYNSNLLLSPANIVGKLLQGEDNAKDSVAIFPALDPDARKFQLFVSGLSGETAEVKNPVNGKPVLLQKTLELDFTIPGQAIGIDPQVRLDETKWVMK